MNNDVSSLNLGLTNLPNRDWKFPYRDILKNMYSVLGREGVVGSMVMSFGK